MKKKIVAIIALCTTLNNATLAGNFGTPSLDFFDKISSVTSAVSRLFCASTMPVDIVNSLVQEESPLRQALTAPPQEQNRDGISYYYFLTGSRTNLVRENIAKDTVSWQGMSGARLQSGVCLSKVHPPPGSELFVFLLLLTYLVLLSMSNLPEGVLVPRRRK